MRVPPVVLAALLLAGCAEDRSLGNGPACVAWREDVQPATQAACAGCHAGDPYDLTSYQGALGPGTDSVPNAIAGDVGSRILTALAEPPHEGVSQATRDLLRRWVGDCGLAWMRSPIHPHGIMNPADGSFHGAILRDSGWDFAACARCHGDDFAGGAAGASCNGCHTGGPTACVTCHDQPPATGAHVAHLGKPPLDKPVACAECHVVPATWDAPGHILAAGGGVDPAPAEVTFGPTAALTPSFAMRAGPPAWDPSAKTCANVYCHGGAFVDAAAEAPVPAWQDGPRTCVSCHGQPPANHGAATQCATCHPRVSGGGQTLASTALHLDGALDLGDGSGGCTACHGGPAGPAPPRDLLGNTSWTAIGVGAHQAHLVSPHRLSAPIACSTCHTVPAIVLAAGHIDTDPPAEVNLAWDRTTRTCAGTCHGASSPDWTMTPDSGGVWCGSCHDVPPATPAHDPTWTLSTCAGCHAATVDAFGNILVTGPPGAETSAHMNGVVDHDP